MGTWTELDDARRLDYSDAVTHTQVLAAAADLMMMMMMMRVCC